MFRAQQPVPVLPGLPNPAQQNAALVHRYEVNVLVSRGTQTGAPVVFERNPIPTSSVVVQRADLLAAGGFAGPPPCEDQDLWLRLLRRGARFVCAVAAYWTLGLVLHAAASPFRGTRSYRQARHLLAYAAAPVALSFFVVWPVRLAVYGEDVFRKGGSDRGAGNWAFIGLELLFVAWSLGLLALGVSVIRSNSSSSSDGIS